jgi:hypothetical protein
LLDGSYLKQVNKTNNRSHHEKQESLSPWQKDNLNVFLVFWFIKPCLGDFRFMAWVTVNNQKDLPPRLLD